ncbi:MAG: hypothetical protein IIT68_02115 [Treponema sp.]|nr:hypothetical protein [Treponema sp.]
MKKSETFALYVTAVAAVCVAVCAVICTTAFLSSLNVHKPAENFDTETDTEVSKPLSFFGNTSPAGKLAVYWAGRNEYMHTHEDCQALRRVSPANLHSGTVEEAEAAGRKYLCTYCAERDADYVVQLPAQTSGDATAPAVNE